MNIALVPTDDNIDMAVVAKVSATLQKQVTADFAPVWGLDADINPFASVEDVPSDHAVIQLVNQLSNSSVEGFHYFDDRSEPHSVVRVDVSDWSLVASHECLEMLADPGGEIVVSAPPLYASSGVVQYLREVCDPCQNLSYGYIIDGLPMSDFYYPNYFDLTATPGARYCATGALTSPRQILPGGYVCYRDAVGGWYKASNVNGQIETKFVPGGLMNGSGRLREKIDQHSRSKGMADVFQDTGAGYKERMALLRQKMDGHKLAFTEFGEKRAKRYANFLRAGVKSR